MNKLKSQKYLETQYITDLVACRSRVNRTVSFIMKQVAESQWFQIMEPNSLKGRILLPIVSFKDNFSTITGEHKVKFDRDLSISVFNLLQNDWSIFIPENASNLMWIRRVKAMMQSPNIFDQGLKFYPATLCLHASSLMDKSINIYFVDIMWFCKVNIKLNCAIFSFGSELKIHFPAFILIFSNPFWNHPK